MEDAKHTLRLDAAIVLKLTTGQLDELTAMPQNAGKDWYLLHPGEKVVFTLESLLAKTLGKEFTSCSVFISEQGGTTRSLETHITNLLCDNDERTKYATNTWGK